MCNVLIEDSLDRFYLEKFGSGGKGAGGALHLALPKEKYFRRNKGGDLRAGARHEIKGLRVAGGRSAAFL